MVVPPHFDAEVVGALRALVQRQLLNEKEADTSLGYHLQAPFEREFAADDVRAAWQLRDSTPGRTPGTSRWRYAWAHPG